MKRWLYLSIATVVCFGVSGAFGQESAGWLRFPYRIIHPKLPAPQIDPNTAASQAVVGATIPLWGSNIPSGGKSYRYVMVGQNPMIPLTSQTTTIPTVLIPLVLTLPGGQVFDPTKTDPICTPQGSAQSLTQTSPIFQNFDYIVGGVNVGSTQYVDFFQRANFWQFTGSGGMNPNYHVLLSLVNFPALRITVPSGHGTLLSPAPVCGPVANVDVNWFDAAVQQGILPALAKYGVGSTTFPIFLLYNTVMYQLTPGNCCILGYHNAYKNGSGVMQTYAVADWDASQSFSGSGDISALSHEVGEWMDDPTTFNPTPPWGNIGQVSNCQSNLEVGDPLSGTVIPVLMPNNYLYHPQEMAFFSWFYRQTPSLGVNGWYSSNGTFTTPAAACP
ncbi:MAG TPA: hypothetical protein VFA33_13105 [Bryobacteraceae bacterium]|nr:hypothetical protein [Bryobacteraceae bacterium]